MNLINTSQWDLLSNYIDQSRSVLLSTHTNSDGDGIGSELAMYYYIKSKNKDCRIINDTARPFVFDIIDPDEVVEKYDSNMDDWLKSIDLVILFDIGDHNRVGEMKKIIYNDKNIIISIDHHPSDRQNPYALNIVDASAPATGYLIWVFLKYIKFLKESKIPINIANALYASLITDTGSFKYQSTTADTHFMAADLINSGIKCYEIQKSIYEQKKLSQIQLLGYVINSLKYSKNKLVVWTIIDQKMIKNANAVDEDVEGFTEFIRAIIGVEVSFMIFQKSDYSLRINFRSSGKYIVNDIAQNLGGGGHKFAAGATINKMTIKDVEKSIIQSLKNKIGSEY